MKIERFYTPRQLAAATGLAPSQCKALIDKSPDRICISRNPECSKLRWAISESGFLALVEQHRQKALRAQIEQQQKGKADKAPPARKGRKPTARDGLNPDGTIMNSRQLEAAGIKRGAAK